MSSRALVAVLSAVTALNVAYMATIVWMLG